MDTNFYQLIYTLLDGTKIIKKLGPGEYILGRSLECDIVLPHAEVSRRHTRLSILEDATWIADLGSANGTRLEDMPLPPRKVSKIQIGETFHAGPFSLTLEKADKELQFDEADHEILHDVEENGISTTYMKIKIEEDEEEVFQLSIHQDDGKTEKRILKDGEWTAGRGREAQIVLGDQHCSRKHLVIIIKTNQAWIKDLGSSNGTFYEDVKIEPNQEFEFTPEKSFKVGKFTLSLERIPISETQQENLEDANPAKETLVSAPEDISKPLNLMGLERITIGRSADNHMVIDHPSVSRYHAMIERLGSRYRLIDTHSGNGIFLNGSRVDEEAWLKQGDEIKVGPLQFIFTGNVLSKTKDEGFEIEALNLKKFVTQKINLLKDISLNIGQNEFVALVGMSGSGKTTLLDAINGYRPATHGKVLVNDIDLYENYDMFRNDIGYVPQRDIVHMALTPQQSLTYAARLRMPLDSTAEELEDAVEDTLDDLGLEERKDLSNARLSGGQLKRVSIGVELLTRPKLFFLDEPTSGLDPGTEYEMMKLLRRLADQGRTVVLITHATKNVMLCDKVIILAQHGHMAYYGAPEDALVYFNQFRSPRERLEKDMEFDDIYRILSDERKGSPEDWDTRFREEALKMALAGKLSERAAQAAENPQEETATKLQATRFKTLSSLKQFSILSARNLKILFNDRVSLWLMLALAPILGLADVVWGRNIFDPVQGNTTKVVSMFFMTAIIAVLVGSLSSIRELVKENDIYKRERAVGLKVFPYILSKVWIGLVLALYQSAVLLIFKILFVNPNVVTTTGYAAYFLSIFLGILSGYLLGLIISAGVPNQNAALIVLIAVLVPQFLFAGAILQLESIPGGTWISSIVPTRWVFEAQVRNSAIGDQMSADTCWDLPENERLMLTDKQKVDCLCLGANIFTNCDQFPGILNPDYFDYESRSELSKSEPVRPNDPPPIPIPEPIKAPQFSSSDSAPEILEKFEDWSNEYIEKINTYTENQDTRFENHINRIEAYGNELAYWEKHRKTAIGAAEYSLSSFAEKWGRAFDGRISTRWLWLAGINLILFLGILIFQKRKDVV
ncbi:MAG: FHA domain-containing protein [Anaerolineaceae bacterium]|nr:FHA domain-containing protein [Anaerolineaceae bacterium]